MLRSSSDPFCGMGSWQIAHRPPCAFHFSALSFVRWAGVPRSRCMRRVKSRRRKAKSNSGSLPAMNWSAATVTSCSSSRLAISGGVRRRFGIGSGYHGSFSLEPLRLPRCRIISLSRSFSAGRSPFSRNESSMRRPSNRADASSRWMRRNPSGLPFR